ncbi:type III secretion system export apparatus subunit SctR [Erythrobacter sp. YT30]|uniref:type III secretion system export apparatus subunit SctR n=1 Tax=Erythrobacter sp. YT30 TaxID=1735012 RepID=UPI00076D835D|nr:type III secretion system export apparatus subunit SctR [Erythrobacter sp. YT30]KWV92072.1 type III secretion system protein SsaR [Erythrobacter sp. YT30]
MELGTFTPGSALVTVIIIALAPFLAVMVTSFTKIVVVLSIVRTALGLQQTPPNVVLNGLALILTIYVMYPTLQDMSLAAGLTGEEVATMPGDEPPDVGQIQDTQEIIATADRVKEPLREFLVANTTQEDRAFLLATQKQISGPERAEELSDTDFVIVIPAFAVRELKLAFQIGFLIFLPFLIIDLLISNILLALNMMMLSPVTISLPFKVLLFVLVDGWVKLSHGLVLSYV